jgi:hypothetical protein
MTDSKLVQLIVERKSKQRKKELKLSWADQREKIIEWTTFYRRNMDIFIEDYLGIKLKFFQIIMIRLLQNNMISCFITSRGAGKSFIVGVYAVARALLYPNSEIAVSSLTLAQGKLIITEKIQRELCGDVGLSPILKQLYNDGYITINVDKDTAKVNFKNDSKIFVAVAGESSRGIRSTCLIVDEARIVLKKIIDSILLPSERPRVFPSRIKDEYKDYVEEPQTIYISSARTKDSWLWTFFTKCVNQLYRKKPYSVFAVDEFTSVACGLKTKQQFEIDQKNTDEFDWMMEHLNCWLGETEDSLFRYDDFHKCQLSHLAFYPSDSNVSCFYDFSNEKEIRYITCDIAVSGGKDNDNTIYFLNSMNIDNKKVRPLYIESMNGVNSTIQVCRMKQLFYDFKCSYAVIDTKGVGNVIYDMLTVETFNEKTLETYPAWTVSTDPVLQISSDNVINDKIKRTISINAESVIIAIAGTPEINTAMHLSVKKNLKDGVFEFLVDESEQEALFVDSDKDWLLHTSEERAEMLLPYVQTRYLINEAVSLKTKILDSNIKVVEQSRLDTKDRYMTLAMTSYFADKLMNKYFQDEENGEINMDDWQWLSGKY